jgi:hypothetical protein
MEGSVRNVVLVCEGCGGRTILGGPLSVWRSGSTSFECECGAQLTLSQQLDHSDADKQAVERATVFYR